MIYRIMNLLSALILLSLFQPGCDKESDPTSYTIIHNSDVKAQSASYVNVIKARSASYADVIEAISMANPEDKVIIPADTAIWGSQLVITKGIYLIGSGSSTTKIIASYSGNYLIDYHPANSATYDKNYGFRISGITFDFSNNCGGIYFSYNGNTNYTQQTKIIIDNNVFENATTQALTINGYFGVAYNNIFVGTDYPIRFASGDSEAWWNHWEGVVFGKQDNNFYFEDNVIECVDVMVDCQYGNRYAFRYNDITAEEYEGSYPLMDMHGNQGLGWSMMWSSFGGEIYGNDISIGEGQLLDIRGGKAVIFCNSVETRSGSFLGVKVREEYCDSLNPVIIDSAYPQHVNDTYIWMNRTGSTGAIKGGYISQNSCAEYQIEENKDFWNYNAAYNGKTEIGIGTGSNLPTKGTPGDGFWLSDQTYDNLTAYTGKEPNTPIDGTLYKFNSEQGWIAYFTPLIYPHPLRGLP